ncbi:DUF1841 family protein [Bailinhaonella thermotolerans]|uniref:DUF1841 family protein n=1 Tax=Bailinhaonella thermotolerans TaxID=1070861 RepID=A0A3A4AS25_9ACTN|nr:DUF1841 family protein [Bailinhaonella thermotolerans]
MFELLLRGARGLLREPGPVEAELLAARLIAPWWRTRLPGDDAEAVLADGAVTYASRLRRPESVALLRALAVLGPPGVRAKSAAAADALVALGVEDPEWAAGLGSAVPAQAWVLADVFGDQETILIAFDQAGSQHAVVTLIDHNLGGAAVDAVGMTDADAALQALRADQAARRFAALSPLDVAEAGVRLSRALSATAELDRADVSDELAETRPFLLRRLEAIPSAPAEPYDDQPDEDAVVAGFLASAPDLPAEADSLARVLLRGGAALDPERPLRISPAKLELVAGDWLPEHVLLTGAQEAALPAVLRAWTDFTADRMDLPDEARRQVVTAALELSADLSLLLDPEEDNPYLAEGEEYDPETVRRRRFALPYTLVRSEWGDLSDEEHRRTLIELEHAGRNEPAHHMTAHLIAVNQLWINDPPIVWGTVQRLMADGHTRHDVLHMLASAILSQVWRTMKDKAAFDPESYARALDALPESVFSLRRPD